MKIQLINLGRNKVNKICEIDTSKGLVNDCIEDTLAGVAGHYLMSRNIEAAELKKGIYSVFAGFRKVGEIKILEE